MAARPYYPYSTSAGLPDRDNTHESRNWHPNQGNLPGDGTTEDPLGIDCKSSLEGVRSELTMEGGVVHVMRAPGSAPRDWVR